MNLIVWKWIPSLSSATICNLSDTSVFLKDAEFVSETVVINRLYHRELITRMSEIEDLEKKWNCKIDFPSTEMASDVVTISGPEYQVPQAVDEFLVLTTSPLSHHTS